VVWPLNNCDGFLWFGLKIGRNGFLWFGLKTGGDGFSRFVLKTDGGGFPCLDLTTGSYRLVIWASKLSRRFLSFSLKTKQATVCRLCHKTDGRAMAWDTRQNLAACFT
jgi:hypothetical protein